MDKYEARREAAEKLFEAVLGCDVEAVRALLSANAHPDVCEEQDDVGDTPLIAAGRLHGPEALSIARLLVEAGAEIDAVGNYGCTALQRAVLQESDDEWALARFLFRSGASPEIRDKDGLNVPEAAANEGFEGAVLALIEEGMSPNVQGVAGSLLWYVSWFFPTLVEELLKRGADVHAVNRDAETALHRAAESYKSADDRSSSSRIISLLIDAGADRYARDKEGRTPAEIAGLTDDEFLAVAELASLGSDPGIKPGNPPEGGGRNPGI